MTKAQEERLVLAFEKFVSTVDAIGKLVEKRLNLEFPPEREQVDAEVYKSGEQEEAQGASPGRFEKLLAEATK
jgi:hypothetical protein